MATKLIATDLDFNNVSKINNLPDATAAQQPITKAQFDAGLNGLNWKDNVKVASTGNVNLASPGDTFDDITVTGNPRVLIKDQTAPAENGIYIWNGAATPMTRSSDADSASELLNAIVIVDEGTANAGSTWRQSEVDITLETDDVIFSAFGAATPAASETTAGKIEIATQAETDTGTDDERAITPEKLFNWSERVMFKTGTVGDNSNTSYAITHNFGTRNVQVEVWRNSGNYDTVICEVRRTDTNTVTLVFSAAVTTDQFAYSITARQG